MSESAFTPPRYEETLHLLFEKETGRVVATERRWTLIGEKPHGGQPARSELLRRVISGLGRHEDNFDVIVLRGAEAGKAPVRRVDVRLREPIREESFGSATKGVGPFRIELP